MDDGENKIRRDSCCQSTSQGDELEASTLFSYDSLGFVQLCVLASFEFGQQNS